MHSASVRKPAPGGFVEGVAALADPPPRPWDTIRPGGLLALAPALLILLYGLWIGPRFDRYVLPAFDGYVYDAMADHPRVFTVAPWGYRILSPWIVHLLPVSSAAVGYFWLNLACLAGAVLIIGSWLKHLGFSTGAATLASTAFAASPPVRALLEYQVLVDPLALLIVTATLWELRSPRVVVLAALFTAGAMAKEICLLPLIMAPLTLVRRNGWRRGSALTLAIVSPAIISTLVLRATWGHAPLTALRPPIEQIIDRVMESGSVLASGAALSGLAILALLGLFREGSVLLRVQGTLLWFLTFAATIASPYEFSLPDLPRLSVFAWPALLPLGLAGIGFKRNGEAISGPRSSRLTSALSIITLLLCPSLVLVTDSFKGAPIAASPDPITFLARVRESLKTARSIENGEMFAFDSTSGRFATPVTQRFNLTEGRQQRWFLFSGFGPEAAFGSGAPEFRGAAELIVPLFVPRNATLSLDLEGPEGALVAVSVAGRSLGSIPADGSATTLLIPQDALVRGDNILTLRGPEGAAIRVIGWSVRLSPSGQG